MEKFYRLLLAILLLGSLNANAQWIDGMFYVDGYDDGLHLRIGIGGDVVIPEYIEVDGEQIPVRVIESGAFRDNQDLKSVVIPKTVTTIQEYSFAFCRSLTEVTLPESSEYGLTLESGCFAYCYGLTSVNIPTSVISMGSDCFYNSGLTEVVIPESLNSISDACFMRCYDLTRATIPSTVTEIGNSAFNGCSSLTDIVMETPIAITSFGKRAFDGCTSLLSFTIPSSVVSLGDNCFDGCSTIESIEIPSSVTSIGDGCFAGCSALKEISPIPAISALGNNLFNGCSSLTSVDLPSTLTSVGVWCFYNCKNITKVTCDAVVPPTADYLCMTGMNSQCIIYVPEESVEAYRSAGGWSIYTIAGINTASLNEIEKDDKEKDDLYGINGVRLKSKVKGINIINGKKFFYSGK